MVRWRAVLYTRNKKSDLYNIDALVSSPKRIDAISMITQYAHTMTDDNTKDIKIIIRPGKAGEDNIIEQKENQ